MTGHLPAVCPLCEAAASRPWHNAYRRCVECSLVFLAPLSVSIACTRLYDRAYFHSPDPASRGYADYAAQEPELTATAHHYLDILLPYLPQRHRIIDLGCGYGYLLAAARPAFTEVLGIDISPAVAAELDRRGLPYHIADFCTLPDGSLPTADLITMFDCLEHCPDPHAAFRLLRRQVAPQGLVALLTPDTDNWLARISGSRWVSLKVPEHPVLHNRTTLAHLCTRHGFTPLLITGGKQQVSAAFLAEHLLRFAPSSDRLVSRLARLLTPLGPVWCPNGNLFAILRPSATPRA